LLHLPSLPQAFDEAESFAQIGSGLLAMPVVPEKGNFVVAFRPECIEEVSWGGNPNEALQFEADGKTYHPRNSFQVWKQTVRHTARAWSPEELAIAEAFRNVLTGIALRRLHA
jgi:light-regulated signal transduction histidine kinase (bacteriophytochrome)